MKNQPTKFTKHTSEPIKKSHLKLKLLILIAILIWTTIGVYGVIDFINSHDFRTPIIVQNPFPSKYKNVIISPVASKSAKTSMIDISDIADKIYTLESSGGKNDGCRKLGLYNGWGYHQNSNEWMCYGSHEEVRQLVINWLEDHIGKYGLEKSLCIYNRGLNETGCTYSMNYLSLK